MTTKPPGCPAAAEIAAARRHLTAALVQALTLHGDPAPLDAEINGAQQALDRAAAALPPQDTATPHVVVLAVIRDDNPVWDLAADLGADHVVFLPDDAAVAGLRAELRGGGG